jgi:hypothetical protein
MKKSHTLVIKLENEMWMITENIAAFTFLYTGALLCNMFGASY